MGSIAVVILNYNGADYLKKFLPSVIAHSGEAEIIVADNQSSDNSLTLIKQLFPIVRIIELDENYGFAEGYNKALEKVDAQYVALLNSDVEVTENWLSEMQAFLEEHPNYAACQPKIKDYNNRDTFEYAGASGGFIDTLGYPYCRGRIFDCLEEDHGQYDDSIDVFWTSGACMLIRNELFKKHGGFDGDFFAHMEEIDLCWRLRSQGYHFRVIPQSVVYHVGGGTLSKLNPQKTFLNFRNGLFMLMKNVPSGQLIIKLLFRLFLDWIAALKYLLECKFDHGLAILKAHVIVITTAKKTLSKRANSLSLPTKPFLIYEHFLKKVERFNRL